MKNKFLIILIVFCSFIFIDNVYAASDYIVLNTKVNIRKGPSTKYGIIESSGSGSSFNVLQKEIVADEAKNGDCDAGWYKIQFDTSTVGYACSTYVTYYEAPVETPTENPVSPVEGECENALVTAGFPVSYVSGLCSLKAKHPNWNFVPLKTGLDWATAVAKESVCGKSLVQTSNPDYIDGSCTSGYGSWKAASQTAVAHYMDPRNFLTEKHIFQFEYLKYDASSSQTYIQSSNTMLANAAFYKYHLGLGNNMGEIINASGAETNVNPVFLSSRMLQELGNSTSLYNLYSGVYTGYDNKYYGYYNFYNIGVTDSCATTYGTSYCGLNHAFNSGWNSLGSAIKGGASSLSKNYISVGQYSTYLQKFNVAPTNTNKLYIHQYMTNIAAPSSESSSTYSTYNKLGLLTSGFTFYIPVFNNMTGNIVNESNGATNETISQTGQVAVSISSIVSSSGYKYATNKISGIKPDTNIATVKGAIESVSGLAVNIYDGSGKLVTDGNLGTGYTVEVSNTNVTEKLTVVVKGDTSGDGKINALDLLQVQKNILGLYELSGAYKEAADPSNDGKTNALDLLQIQKSILGQYEIGQ